MALPPHQRPVVSMKDTHAEEDLRRSLRTQFDDFVYAGVSGGQFEFAVTDKIRDALIRSGIVPFTQPSIQPFVQKLPAATGLPLILHEDELPGRLDDTGTNMIFFLGTPDKHYIVRYRYTTTSPQQDRLFIMYQGPSYPEFLVIQSILNTFSDIALSKQRKDFVMKKMADRAGQSYGLDALASQAQIRPFLGGRRRKTKKHTKKHRTTRRRHLRIKH